MSPVPTKRFDRSVSMLSFGYNEEASVESFFEKAFALLGNCIEDFELVFVDDGSRDRTSAIAARYAEKNPRLRIITHPKNLTIGPALKTAISGATKEFLFWQTVDWSYDLTHLRTYLELLKHFDVVVCVRPGPAERIARIPLVGTIARAKGRSDNLFKAIVSLTNFALIKALYGLPFSDYQNIHFYPTALLQSFRLEGNSSFLNPEMLTNAYARGCRFIEVPITFIPRNAGKAKGTKPKAIYRSVRDISVQWLRWGARFRWENLFQSGRRVWRATEPAHLSPEVRSIVEGFETSAGPS